MADAYVEFLKAHFFNRTDVVAVFAPWSKPTPVEVAPEQFDQLLLGHVYGDEVAQAKVVFKKKASASLLAGQFRVGTYTPSTDGTTRWGCIDFDGSNHKHPLLDPLGAAKRTLDAFAAEQLPAYLERSGSGQGYHVWFFFEAPVPAHLAQELAHSLIPSGIRCADGSPAAPASNKGIEVFPKAPKLKGNDGKGNMLWLPFWSGGKNGGARFYRLDGAGELEMYEPAIVPVSTARAQEVLAARRPAQPSSAPTPARTAPRSPELSDAAQRYNHDHPRELPTASSGCPVCGSPDGFKVMPESPNRWVCFSSRHTAVGIRGHDCWHGDVLDLDAHAASCSRGELLRRQGYLAPMDGSGPEASEDVQLEAEARFDRPTIRITTEEHIVNAQAEKALSTNSNVYQRAAALVMVTEDAKPPPGLRRPPGSPVIKEITSAVLRQELTRVAGFEKYSLTREQWEPAHPTEWMVSATLEIGQWPDIRSLEAIVETPVLRPDGSVLEEPGYDSSTGYFLLPSVKVPALPAKPTKDQAIAAKQMLLDLVVDFPWHSRADKAAWLAGALTPFCRAAMSAPSPLLLIDANMRGSGKSRLADLISLIFTGRTMARLAPCDNDEEMRKRITSIIIAGDPLVLLDNVIEPLGGAALDAMLTGSIWMDRKLGENTRVALPMTSTWFASGNNVQVYGDTARRTLRSRLDSTEEHPEERTNFKYPNLVGHVAAHRAELVAACLTILRAFNEAGRPGQRLSSFGSYEVWSSMVREAVVWCDEPDPVITNKEFAVAADPMTRLYPALLEGLETAIALHRKSVPKAKGITAADLVKLLDEQKQKLDGLRSVLLELCPQRGDDLPTVRSIGNQFARLKARPSGSGSDVRALDAEDGRAGAKVWFVARLERGGTYNSQPVEPQVDVEPPHREEPVPSTGTDNVIKVDF